ncbi:MAG: YcxB family protein [Clostridia bacterium]|nr:YcxB family protein [Clostridia bacterium]
MKCSCEINQEVQIELNKKAKRNSIIALIVGLVGLLVYICIPTSVEYFLLEILLWVSSFIFVFGIVFLVTINKANKKVIANKITAEFELEEGYMIVNSIKNGEQINSSKVYYKDIVKIRETEHYIFLYPNRQMAYPLPKSKLTNEEVTTLRSWLNLQAK